MRTVPKSLFEKVWESHVVREEPGEHTLLYVDLHLVHEVTSPQAFEALRLAGRPVRRPDLTLATMDHNVQTADGPVDPLSHAQLEALRRNCAEFGVPLYATGSGREGIVHVIGPELGLTQPGMTIVCGDSHTSTHGAFGVLAFGIGTSEVEHVLATQTLSQRRPRSMRVEFTGSLPPALTSKDVILGAIGRLGVSGGVGHVLEYSGEVDPRPLDGRPPDHLQHVHRGRRPGRNDLSRRHDVRLSRRPSRGAEGRGVGAGPRSLARAADGRGRRLRRGGRDRRLRARAAGHLGHEPGHGGSGGRGRSGPGDLRRSGRARRCRARARLHGHSSPGRRSRTSGSTGSSSARARTRASRICARPPRSWTGSACTRRCARWWCRDRRR